MYGVKTIAGWLSEFSEEIEKGRKRESSDRSEVLKQESSAQAREYREDYDRKKCELKTKHGYKKSLK